MMLLAVGILSLPWSTAGALRRNSWGIPICLGFVGLAYIVVSEPPFRDESADKISMVNLPPSNDSVGICDGQQRRDNLPTPAVLLYSGRNDRHVD